MVGLRLRHPLVEESTVTPIMVRTTTTKTTNITIRPLLTLVRPVRERWEEVVTIRKKKQEEQPPKPPAQQPKHKQFQLLQQQQKQPFSSKFTLRIRVHVIVSRASCLSGRMDLTRHVKGQRNIFVTKNYLRRKSSNIFRFYDVDGPPKVSLCGRFLYDPQQQQ